jgi:hypothetical protein
VSITQVTDKCILVILRACFRNHSMAKIIISKNNNHIKVDGDIKPCGSPSFRSGPY